MRKYKQSNTLSREKYKQSSGVGSLDHKFLQVLALNFGEQALNCSQVAGGNINLKKCWGKGVLFYTSLVCEDQGLEVDAGGLQKTQAREMKRVVMLVFLNCLKIRHAAAF